MSHKFSVGQVVTFLPGAGEPYADASKAVVLRLLPREGIENQYHVRIELGGPDRRVIESQLREV